MSGFSIEDLGLMDYRACLAYQRLLLERIQNRQGQNVLLLVEHPPVITLGAGFHSENLLHPPDWYQSRGIEVLASDRGGDVTLHSPGQLVAYPIFDLEPIGKDLHRWLRQIEQAVIVALDSLGATGSRIPGLTGVWIGERKVCAIGIKVRRWVSMHGLALNCSNDLSLFESIVPCGIKDREVTSLSQELGHPIEVARVKPLLASAFAEIFP
jgi:lipoyl(octanoyl) transferase